jgi:hypothetical protein
MADGNLGDGKGKNGNADGIPSSVSICLGSTINK